MRWNTSNEVLTDAELHVCTILVNLGLGEDLGSGDRTSEAMIPKDQKGSAFIVARSNGILAGLPAAELTMETVSSLLLISLHPGAPNEKHAGHIAADSPTMEPILL